MADQLIGSLYMRQRMLVVVTMRLIYSLVLRDRVPLISLPVIVSFFTLIVHHISRW